MLSVSPQGGESKKTAEGRNKISFKGLKKQAFL